MELSTLIAQNLEDIPSKLVDLQLFLDNINSGSGLGGTNYVFVRGNGTPQENAIELQAAYDTAKTMPRYLGSFYYDDIVSFKKNQTYCNATNGPSDLVYYRVLADYEGQEDSLEAKEIITEQEAKSTRTTVIVAPGEYTFTTVFTVDAPGINIVSLTGNSDVILNSINVTANDVYLKGINCGNAQFVVSLELDKLTCENCIGGDESFGGYYGTASGTFINCTGGDQSFGGGSGGTASGTFEKCTGGDNSFGGGGGTASGTFTNCTGGVGSFGGNGGTASGVFTNCTGGDFSFGGGYGSIYSTAKLYYCRLTSGTFGIPALGGKLVLCIDGSDAIVTTA